MNDQKNSSEPPNGTHPSPLSVFYDFLTSTEAYCNNCKRKFKFSTKATSNLITHLRRCSPHLYSQYTSLKNKPRVTVRKSNEHHCPTPVKSFTQPLSPRQQTPLEIAHKPLTKALLKSIACDQLPLNIVESETFRSLLFTAESRLVIPSLSTFSNSIIPMVVQQMEEVMRKELASLEHVYLTIDLWTNQNLKSFMGVSIHFVDSEWKLRNFVLSVNSFAGKHTPQNVAKTYVNTIKKFNLTKKVAEVVSDSALSIIKASTSSLPKFSIILTNSKELNGDCKEELLTSLPNQDVLEVDTDFNSLFAYLPDRVSHFALAKQLCIQECLQEFSFVKSAVGKHLGKISKLINLMMNSVDATSYLQQKKIILDTTNVAKWIPQLDLLQSVLKNHEEVNEALSLIRSQEKIKTEDYLVLSELINVLMPFKEAMQQVEREDIVTSSCICPVIVGILKALEQQKNSQLQYCSKLVENLKDSVSKTLLPYLKNTDNRLASLLDPRFKTRWLEDDVEKGEAIKMLMTHLARRLGKDEEQNLETQIGNGTPSKKPKLFDFMGTGSVKRESNSAHVSELGTYLEEEALHYDEDPLLYWKKKSKDLPTLAALAKDYLGAISTSATSKRLFSIDGNLQTPKRNLQGEDIFRNLMFIKFNTSIFDQVQV